MRLHSIPVGRDIARRFIAEHHRHNLPPLGAVFYLGVADETGTLRGVASVGRPVARHADDGFTLEITRVCTDGASGAPSFLYAAAVRVGRELGYRRAITYTLSTEPGTSLRAAGFTPEAELPPRPTWDTPTRPRVQLDLFGQERRPPASKIRWARSLRRGRPTL